jgi:hypothetical protein
LVQSPPRRKIINIEIPEQAARPNTRRAALTWEQFGLPWKWNF